MTETTTNRYGDEIRVGQHWLDPATRDDRRTLRVDRFEDAGSLGTVAVCTVVAVYSSSEHGVSHPDRVVEINVDRLRARPSARGYQLATGTFVVRVADRRHSPFGLATIRTITLDAICPLCSGPRGVPFDYDFVNDGEVLTCDQWLNPCGHFDMYNNVLVEAERAQAAAVSEG
ncbi:hypothetical protein [Prescottella agglutinans]|jgi:hypothetical protein|uniref:Uncharacterized protein n=1 Tax=Prescottella agglutinans TaxID=1644129 RepID=A0ABT6MJK7_9NOCA|nr:hypothetical protein [Prescottella agglutinans]MDH6284501.1 hypothetical protein [Prescottella agglutinans]